MPNDPNEATGEAVSAPKPFDLSHERDRLESLFRNLARVVSVIHWHTSQEFHRATNVDGEAVYEMSESSAEELCSLLYVADAFATAGLKEGEK